MEAVKQVEKYPLNTLDDSEFFFFFVKHFKTTEMLPYNIQSLDIIIIMYICPGSEKITLLPFSVNVLNKIFST